MTSINLNVIGLTQPGHKVENAMSRFEPVTFRFPDLPEWEADALLIQPPRPVLKQCSTTYIYIYIPSGMIGCAKKQGGGTGSVRGSRC